MAQLPMPVTRTTEHWTPILDGGRDDGRLVQEAIERAREPRLAPLPGDLHPEVLAALRRKGIDAI